MIESVENIAGNRPIERATPVLPEVFLPIQHPS